MQKYPDLPYIDGPGNEGILSDRTKMLAAYGKDDEQKDTKVA